MNEHEAFQIFDGVMLSDGSLTRSRLAGDPPGTYQGYKNSGFHMALSGEEHLDWLEYTGEALVVLGVSLITSSPHTRRKLSRGKAYLEASLETRVSPFLTLQKRRWYPSGVKEVPPDLTLTPLLLANWFMGDGGTTMSGGGPSVYVWFATHSYPLSSVERLEEKLQAFGDLGVNRYRDKRVSSNGYYLVAGAEAKVDHLMSMVEPYVLSSYRYKIK